jgi:FSR family fosmidomycin resistance protein-like MFS transporter
MSDQATIMSANWIPWRSEARIMGLIGLAHMTSHFFHLIIAPLFPWLRIEFGYSFTELGFLMTMFFIVSGIFQAAAGFVVDRFGAGITLLGGLLCLSLYALCLGLSNSYAWLIAGVCFGGLGNSVFHPVDFSLLNSRISVSRLGPAYSVHGLTGNIGWALAPVFLVGIATPFGWRAALLCAAVLPLVVIGMLLLNRDVIRDIKPDLDDRDPMPNKPVSTDLAFLRDPKIWWCFSFFALVSVAIGATQNFAPSIFSNVYALDTQAATMSIIIMMLTSAVGMVMGGWLVSRSPRLEQNITLALVMATASAVLVGVAIVPSQIALLLMGVMGFGIGLSGPSRDMLIRTVTPEGATGRVYGVVYSGLDVGLAIAPALFGGMLDRGYFAAVFYGVAACLCLSIVTARRATKIAAG